MSPDDVDELFAAFGHVSVRRLFGGAGLYAGETMFGLLHDGIVYLKADGGNAASFDRENLAPFSYSAHGSRREIRSYRRIPDRLYDDSDELALWAREAVAAARRASVGQKPVKEARRGRERDRRRVRRP